VILQGSATQYGTGDTRGFFKNMDPFTIAAIAGGIGKVTEGATGGSAPTSSQARSDSTGGMAYSGGNYLGSPFVLNGSGAGEGVAGGYGYSGLPTFQGFESAGSDPNQTRGILIALAVVLAIWIIRKK
jgi:hypothetical protein